MQTIWGIDLGTSSIGWAIVEWDGADEGHVLSLGARTFEEPVEPKGKASKAIARRTARGMRRNTIRRAERRRLVLALIRRAQLAPEVEAGWRRLNPYCLRARCLEERLTLAELGRVLLHLSQRRGFQSNRKSSGLADTDFPEVNQMIAEAEDAALKRKESRSTVKNQAADEDGIVLGNIAALQEEMRKRGSQTLGAHLKELLDQGSSARRRHTLRAMHQEEFERIWEAQRRFYPEKLTDSLKSQFFQALYFQRPLRDQSSLRGPCRLEPGRQAAPKAHHLYQRFKALAVLGNIQTEDAQSLEVKRLSQEQIRLIYSRLIAKDKLTWGAFRKELRLPKDRERLRINLESSPQHKELEGSATDVRLTKATEGQWAQWTPDKQEEVIDFRLRPGTDRDRLNLLVRQAGLDPVIAYRIVTTELPAGVGAYSVKALRKLVPYLESGLQLYDAQIAAGYTPDHESKAEVQDKILLDDLPLIRNPSVSKAVHEARKLINAMMREHGRPDLIRIELARDLSLGRKAKKDLEDKQKKGRKQNEDADKAARANGVVNPGRWDRIKHRLWEECRGNCPYTGQTIPIGSLWTKDWEIEHILPISKSLDSSLHNLTLCPSEVNQAKGNRTAAEFFDGRPEAWAQACERVDAWRTGRHKKKLWRMRSEDISDEFVARQLTDTAYASREVRDMMRRLSEVQTSSGRLTAVLRRQWGLNNLASPGEEKTRDSHLHHAVDAAVIALATPAMVKRISDASRQAEERHDKLQIHAPLPWPRLRADLAQALAQVVVSHEPRHKVRGALHEDTGYGRRDGKFVTRKAVEALTAGEIERVIDPGLRRHLREAVAREGDLKTALAAPFVIIDRHGVERTVRRVRIWGKKQKPEVYVQTKTAWYPAGDNHACLILERPDESRTAHVIKLFDARRAILEGRSLESLAPPGFRVLMILRKNDMVELEGASPGIYVVKGFSPENPVYLRLVHHTYSGSDVNQQVRLRSDSSLDNLSRRLTPSMLGVE